MHTPDEVIANKIDLFSLDPGTTYQIRVVSKNGDGLEAPTAWQEFMTDGVGEYMEVVVMQTDQSSHILAFYCTNWSGSLLYRSRLLILNPLRYLSYICFLVSLYILLLAKQPATFQFKSTVNLYNATKCMSINHLC